MRHKSRANCALAVILLTTSSLISSTHSTQIGTVALGEPPQNISKRERQLVGIIERHALSFAIEKFVKDPVIMQTQTYTTYINLKASSTANRVVLRKKNEDTGKDAIVLSSAYNRFAIPTPRGAKKRQFVLFRKGPNQNDDEGVSYYSSLIFVRNLYSGDENKNTFMVDGVESVVEFDIWEHRPRKFFPGWGNCDWSILFTCASVDEILQDAEKAAGSKRRRRSALTPVEAAEEGMAHRLFKRVPLNDSAEDDELPDLSPITGAPGFDPATYNDLYLDMDFHRFDLLYAEEDEEVGEMEEEGEEADGEDYTEEGEEGEEAEDGEEAKEAEGEDYAEEGEEADGEDYAQGDEEAEGMEGAEDVADNRRKRATAAGGKNNQGKGKGGGQQSKGGAGSGSSASKSSSSTSKSSASTSKSSSSTSSSSTSKSSATTSSAGSGGKASASSAGSGGKASASSAGSGGKASTSSAGSGGKASASNADSGGKASTSSAGQGTGGGQSKGGAYGGSGSARGSLGGSFKIGGASASGNTRGQSSQCNWNSMAKSGYGGAKLGRGAGVRMGGRWRGRGGIKVGGRWRGKGGIKVGGRWRARGGIKVGGRWRGKGGIKVGGRWRGKGGIKVGGRWRGSGGIKVGGRWRGRGRIKVGGRWRGKGGIKVGGRWRGRGGIKVGGRWRGRGGIKVGGRLRGGGGTKVGGKWRGAVGVKVGMRAKSNGGGRIKIGSKAHRGGRIKVGGRFHGGRRIKVGGRLQGGGAVGGRVGGKLHGAVGISAGAKFLSATGVRVGGKMQGGSGASSSGKLHGSAGIGASVSGKVQKATSAAASAGGKIQGTADTGASGAEGTSTSSNHDVLDFSHSSSVSSSSSFSGISTTELGAGLSGMFGGGAEAGETAEEFAGVGGSASLSVSLSFIYGDKLESVASGMADSMVQAGEWKLNTWSVLGKTTIEHSTTHLIKMGISYNYAKLAVVGKSLCTASFSGMFATQYKFGWRLGIDIAGCDQNGGGYAGKGFEGEESLPTNENYIFGILYNGAENGQYFFLPQGCMVRVLVKVSGGNEFNAWFEPKLTGLDGIFPDDDDSYQKAVGAEVKLLPVQYEQVDSDSDPGIKGTLQEGFKFTKDGKKITGIYKPGDSEWEEQVWMPPELEFIEAKPAVTSEGQKIFYGYLFNGIEDSPHIFLAEGDSLTGVFIPADSNFPGLTDTPHGIFTPTHPAGHAIFVADDPKETKNFNEVRGVFLPDAMDLSGGISGKLAKWEECNCDIKFSFVLDRPGVEYMYTSGNDQKNIWSPYISSDDWKFEPKNPTADEEDQAATEAGTPEEDDDDEVPDPLPETRNDEEGGDSGRGDDEISNEEKKKITYPGAKIKTKHSLIFIPEDFKIVGGITPVDMKKKVVHKGMMVDMIMTSSDDPWDFNITKKDGEKLPDGLSGLFVPMMFSKNDAIVGQLIFDPGQMTGKFVVRGILPVEAHLWVATDEFWVPVGFIEKQIAEAKAESNKESKDVQEAKAKEAEQKAIAEAEQRKAVKGEQQQKQLLEREKKEKEKEGEIQKAGHKPKTKKANVKSSSDVPGNEGDYPPRRNANLFEGRLKGRALEDPELNKEIEEEGNEEADEYVHGFYVQTSASPEPIFAPDTGTQGLFVTDDNKEAKAWYFPKRGELNSALIVDSGADGMKGKFYTVNSTNHKSIGYLEGTYKDKDLQADGIETIPGWEMRDEEAVAKEDLNGDLDDEYFKPSQSGQKYALVYIGGGFHGVIVGSGDALDDPNNPIFQEFLHFRMARDGDVNPWGKVAIIDPIQREKVDKSKENEGGSVFGASMTLGKGRIIENKMAAEIMAGFSFYFWEYPEINEYISGVKRKPVRLGKRTNVVNMMDFRMFLYKKYSCKRATVEGDNVVLITPRAANGFVNLTRHARPRVKWFAAVNDAGVNIVFPDSEAVTGKFSAIYEIDAENVAPYERIAGTDEPTAPTSNGAKDTGDWQTSAQFEDWGDENACDEIALDGLQASQAIAAMQDAKDDKSSNGISLGYKLVHGRGNRIKFHKIAKKFLKNYERKSEEGEQVLQKTEQEGESTTDLMGGMSLEAEYLASEEMSIVKDTEELEEDADGLGIDTGSMASSMTMGRSFGASGDAKVKAQVGGGGSAQGSGAAKKGSGAAAGAGAKAGAGAVAGASGAANAAESVNASISVKKGSIGTDLHAKVLPGWRTQHREMIQNVTLSDNGILYYGLGNCKHDEITDIDLLMSKKLNKVIKYYLKVLRIECMSNAEEKIIDLINQGFLKLAKDSDFGYFKIPEDNKLMTAQRLTPAELKKISLAWEIHAVTRTYSTMRERQFLTTGYYKEPYCIVTRSGLYFTELTLYTVAFARKTIPTHGVRMNRNMLMTLRTLMTKLQQDLLLLQDECKDCDLDVRLTEGDKFRVMSLIQFIIYGLGPHHYGEKYPRAAFHEFVELNNVAMTERVKEFDRQYALKTQGRI